MIDIAELRRLEAEATPGLVRSYELYSGDVIVETANSVPLKVARFHQGAIVDAKREAALYVAMRNALPELLKAVETIQQIENTACEGLDCGETREALIEIKYAARKAIPPRGGVDVAQD